MGVAKTCISEIFVKEHELKAFGILNGMWGLGMSVRLNSNYQQQNDDKRKSIFCTHIINRSLS